MVDEEPSLEMESVELLTNVNIMAGGDPAQAKIVSYIYLSPEEISVAELIKKTGYSAATICNKTKALVNLGLLKRVSKAGTKKAFFFMEKDMKKTQGNILKKIIEVKLKPLKENLPKIIKKHSQKNKKEDLKRLEIIKDMLEQINFLEKIINDTLKKIEG